MKKIALTLTLVATLLGSGARLPCYAQTPNPAATAAPAVDHAQLEAALKQLGLKPRQKIEIGRLMKEAKAKGQDRKVTMQQLGAVLTPEQKTQLVDLLKTPAAQPKP